MFLQSVVTVPATEPEPPIAISMAEIFLVTTGAKDATRQEMVTKAMVSSMMEKARECFFGGWLEGRCGVRNDIMVEKRFFGLRLLSNLIRVFDGGKPSE